MWAGVASARAHLLWLNDLDDAWLTRIGLGVDDVNPRRAQPWDNEVTPFEIRVWRIRTQGRATGIPAKVMQLIPDIWQGERMHKLPIRRRVRIQVDDPQRIRLAISLHRRDVGQTLCRRLHGQPGRRIKRWIGLQ